ncbi:hypothetical protein AHAS_Ahas17G0240500 [Arachis hypogaea]
MPGIVYRELLHRTPPSEPSFRCCPLALSRSIVAASVVIMAARFSHTSLVCSFRPFFLPGSSRRCRSLVAVRHLVAGFWFISPSIASIVGSKQRIGGSAPSIRKICASLTHAKRSQCQLSSCFLIYMKDDSIEGIYDTLKECAVISKSARRIGVSVHNICATGSYICGINGTSNGIDQRGGKRKGRASCERSILRTLSA